MRTFFNKIINIVLPERDSYKQVRRINELKVVPGIINLDGLAVHYLLEFRDKRVRACIHEAKFYNNKKAQTILGKTISEFLKQQATVYDLVIPIPLSKERRRERGYNQIEEILKQANIGFDSTILTRANRPAQTTLSREERVKNVYGVFTVVADLAPTITGRRILLIDDVVTTGATLNAAKAALWPHQPTAVICLALAH